MERVQQFNITLPDDMANLLKDKVRSGEYASESDVMHAGLRSLFMRERSVDHWLHHHVGPAIDALNADPSRARSLDRVRASLAAEHAQVK